MQPVMSKSEKRVVLRAVLVFFGALLITGTMDYADQKKQEAVICSRKPAAEYCK